MKKKVIPFIIIVMAMIMVLSCKQILEVSPESTNLQTEKTFKTNDDALNALNGCYATMQDVVDQIYIAGEMQGELVDAARGCDSIPFLKQILVNDVTPQNHYTDYTRFYKIVETCNSAITGFDNLSRINPDFKGDLRDLYKAHAIIIRSWAYLQMVKIWGEVPYVSNAIFEIDSVKNIAATPANEILSRIAADVKSQLPVSDIWQMYSISLNKFTFNSVRILLAEIYTWMGQYENAYDAIKKFLPYSNAPYNTVDGSQTLTQTFYPFYFSSTRKGGLNWIIKYNDTNGPLQNFVASFYIEFDGSRGQKNSIMRWCNNEGNGIYAIKPSSWAIKNWAAQPRDSLLFWLNPRVGQVILPNRGPLASKLTGDWFRGGGNVFTYGDASYIVRAGSYWVDGTDTVIYKPLVKSSAGVNVSVRMDGATYSTSPFTLQNLTRRSKLNNDSYTNDDFKFFLWGEGWMQLWVAELFNQIGRTREALAILNERSGTDFLGIRRRNGLFPVLTNLVENGTEKRQVDDAILNEMSLESAFEGYRWFDLVRFAKRYNDPSILANTVAKKYPLSKQAAIRARLSNPNRWFFPYYYKNVEANNLLHQKPGY
jgi:hypothetical protein